MASPKEQTFMELWIEEHTDGEVFCAVCLDRLISAKIPVTLPGCRHDFCLECVKMLILYSETNGIKCPTCRRYHPAHEVRDENLIRNVDKGILVDRFVRRMSISEDEDATDNYNSNVARTQSHVVSLPRTIPSREKVDNERIVNRNDQNDNKPVNTNSCENKNSQKHDKKKKKGWFSSKKSKADDNWYTNSSTAQLFRASY